MRNTTSKTKIAENALRLYGEYSGPFKADVYKLRKDPDRVTIRFLWNLCKGIGCSYADFFRNGNQTMANLPVGQTGLKRIKQQMEKLELASSTVACEIGVRPVTLRTFLDTGYHPTITPDKFEALLDTLQITPAIYAGKEAAPEKEPEPAPEQKPETQQDLFCMEEPKPGRLVVEFGGKWYQTTGWQEVTVEEVTP